MASTSKDDNRYQNGSGPERPGKAVGGKRAPKASEVAQEDTGSAPLIGEPSEFVKDEELIEMLEQLSDTIDTAQTILTDNQLPGPHDKPATPRTAVDAPAPQAQPARADGRTLSTATSLGIGICLGVGILAAFWLHANWPRQISGVRHSHDQSPAAASVVARKSAVTPGPEATAPEMKQPDEIAAVPHPPQVSARSRSATDASSHEWAIADTASPNTLESAPGATQTEKPKTVATTQPAKLPAPPPLDAGEEVRLLEKGNGFSVSGDIASARLVYEHAANLGSAHAMYALAQTFDPSMLARWKVIGITPDATLALEWYIRAARLGHDAADARAHELEQQTKR